MSDNKNPGAMSGVKQTWANPKARKAILLTGCVVGAVLVVTGLSLRNKGNGSIVASNAQLTSPPSVQTDILAKVTPQYQQMMVTKDNDRAKAAARSDLEMALPQVIGLSQTGAEKERVKPAPVAAVVEASPPPMQTPVQAPAVIQPETQTRAQLEQLTRTSPAYQLAGAFMSSAAQQMTSAKTAPFNIILSPQSTAKASNSSEQDGIASPSAEAAQRTTVGVSSMPVTPAVVIVGAGQALFATMDTAINSDYSGPVVATVRQGKYSGSKIIGTKSLEYEAVVLKFNMMSMPNGGPAIPIQAYAINLGDVSKFGSTGLQGKADYHVMQRYVLPAILAFGQTYGYAASMSGSSTTTTQTSTTQTVKPLSGADRALVALGGALAPIAADLLKQSARPITIQMSADTEIGVLFTQDVTDKTAKAAADQSARGINVALPATNEMPVMPVMPVMPAVRTSGSMNQSGQGSSGSGSVYNGGVAPRNNTGNFGQAPTSNFTAPYTMVNQ